MALRRPGKRKAVDPDQAADPNVIEQAAVAHLARRDFASGELRQKLVDAGFEAQAVDPVIETLRERRYLDDGRFAEAFVTAHADRGQGPHRIREELKALVPSDVAQAALAAGPDWGALARRVRAAKFGPEAPPDWKTKARQARFLQYRGFSADHIRRAFGGDFDESVLESAD